MRDLMTNITVCLLLVIQTNLCLSQTFSDPKYYLVDSLALEQLSPSDIELVENSLTQYHAAKDDTSKINALSSICEGMIHEDWIKFQFFQHELIEKAIARNSAGPIRDTLNNSLAGALNNLGFIYYNQGEINLSLEHYKKGLKIYEETENRVGVAAILNNVGSIYDDQGDILSALEYYHKSLKILEELGSKKSTAVLLNNIGIIYKNQGEIQTALNYYTNSLKIKEEVGDEQAVSVTLNNIGILHEEQGDLDLALEFHQKSLTIAKELGDKKRISICLNSIGKILEINGSYDKALAAYKSSLKIQNEIADKKRICKTLNQLAGLMKIQGNYNMAIEYNSKALALAQEAMVAIEIKVAAYELWKSYSEKNQYKTALEMHELYITTRDSIQSEKHQKEVIRQQYKYQYEKQLAADSIKNLEARKLKDAEFRA